jgi:hypothetical protein
MTFGAFFSGKTPLETEARLLIEAAFFLPIILPLYVKDCIKTPYLLSNFLHLSTGNIGL